MVTITDRPPARIAGELETLQGVLDKEVPEREVDHNLLIGTWNLRAFGDLTKKWHSQPGDSPVRDFHSIRCIAEVLSRFDVVALQEIRGDLRALRYTLKVLNDPDPHWGVILTDVCKSRSGNYERMAFLFDTRRVKPCGLAAELVLPNEVVEQNKLEDGALGRQFARTPYAVAFYSGGRTFILVTVHIVYGDKTDTTERQREIQAIADWLADWAHDLADRGRDHNLIALGDFNIKHKDDPLYQALASRGLSTPVELDHAPRTIFEETRSSHYDQIAWFSDENGKVPYLSLDYRHRAGSFDFKPHCLRDLELTDLGLSWRISDHLPLWAEFLVRPRHGGV
jgi:endonuclease/exonuclease/phosphatase family metal-dependent hydrolase